MRGFLARRKVERMKMASDERYAKAAVILQKYFRMWKAQAQLIHMQLYSSQNETQRIYFSQQVELILSISFFQQQEMENIETK